MTQQIEISPEIARLASLKTKAAGIALAQEMARTVAQEAIMALDPELGFMLDEDAAFSSNDGLVAAFGVSDIVVGNTRIDVRLLNDEGAVSINRNLLNNAYMTGGSLVVKMSGSLTGTVIGFISTQEWRGADATAGEALTATARPSVLPAFDLAATLSALPPHTAAQPPAAPSAKELSDFIGQSDSLAVNKQRALVESTLLNSHVWEELGKLARVWSKATIREVLSASAAWNQTVERLVEKLTARFKRVSKEQIRDVVCRLGETYGGQPELGQFRQALLAELTEKELAVSLSGATLRKATEVVNSVLSGRTVTDAINSIAGNTTAVQIASQIKKQRERVADFMEATALELAGAFQQLAMQPAYATHSQDPQGGIEAINDALKLLDAAELAADLRDIDMEIANG